MSPFCITHLDAQQCRVSGPKPSSGRRTISVKQCVRGPAGDKTKTIIIGLVSLSQRGNLPLMITGGSEPRALLSLCTALCVQAAIVAAARYGGDTDTMACMTGAMAGALHGPAWVPEDW